MIIIKTIDSNSFEYNANIFPKESCYIQRSGSKIGLLKFDGINQFLIPLRDVSEWDIDGSTFTDPIALVLILKDIVYGGGSSVNLTPIITKLDEVIDAINTPTLEDIENMIDPSGIFVIKTVSSDGTVTYTLQDGSTYLGDTTLLLPYENKTQELIEKTIEKPLIPIDFKLLAGTYTNANILSGKYSGSETKIHSIQILSEDVDAFSLDVVGDLEIITDESSQTLRAVKNAELPPFTLVVNTGFEVIINIELLTI